MRTSTPMLADWLAACQPAHTNWAKKRTPASAPLVDSAVILVRSQWFGILVYKWRFP